MSFWTFEKALKECYTILKIAIICDAIWGNQSEVKHKAFSVFYLIDKSVHLEKYILLKAPPESDQWFQSYEQFKDSQNKTKEINSLVLAVSHNQCSRLPTDPARFQHICKALYVFEKKSWRNEAVDRNRPL